MKMRIAGGSALKAWIVLSEVVPLKTARPLNCVPVKTCPPATTPTGCAIDPTFP